MSGPRGLSPSRTWPVPYAARPERIALYGTPGFGGPGGYFTAHLSDQMLSHQLGTYAMWWGLGSQALEPSVLLTRQLPDAHQFIAMLTGAWTDQGWYTIDRTDAF